VFGDVGEVGEAGDVGSLDESKDIISSFRGNIGGQKIFL
jgi:hypothetical protein